MKNWLFPLAAWILLAASAVWGAEATRDRAVAPRSREDGLLDSETDTQHVLRNPTAEGYNRLAIALEREGRFAEAVDAYDKAALLSDGSREAKINRLRARLRSVVQRSVPYAAIIFSGLLAILGGQWLVKYLTTVWSNWRSRAFYRAVRAVRFSARVLCGDGQDQPDGRVYPDSKSVWIKADVHVPVCRDRNPVELELQIIRPDGRVWKRLPHQIVRGDAEPVATWFKLEQLAGMLSRSGSWQAQLVLRNTGKRLASKTLSVVSRADLIADLEVRNVRLLAWQENRPIATRIIFPDVESVVPTAEIRPKTFHFSKFSNMRLRLILVKMNNANIEEKRDLPLQFRKGRMEFCSISRPIAGDAIAGKLGSWEFRLIVESRLLARWPMRIVSVEQAVEHIRVESFRLVGIQQVGPSRVLGSQARADNLQSICPMIKIAAALPSPRSGLRVTVAVCVEDRLVAAAEQKLIVGRDAIELMPGCFPLPAIQEGCNRLRVKVVLVVEQKTLDSREVILQPKPPRCADVQGRITDPSLGGDFDFDSEADRIMREARVA